MMSSLYRRIIGRYRRYIAARFFNNTIVLKTGKPLISFSFDDAPRTSFTVGADLLNRNGVKGTFFVSLGLLGCEAPGGTIAYSEDILRVARVGHELGCHTYDHLDAWAAPVSEFRKSILKNQQELQNILPHAQFHSFAYPISDPAPLIKRCAGTYFKCCRGGGQTFNAGNVDLNLLRACFLDWRNRGDITAIKQMIDRNAKQRGWLIFATHDVADHPSRYGCTRDQLDALVQYSLKSGAEVLPIGGGVKRIMDAARN